MTNEATNPEAQPTPVEAARSVFNRVLLNPNSEPAELMAGVNNLYAVLLGSELPVEILKLIDADFISVEDIASRTGLAKTTVTQYISNIRTKGIAVEKVRDPETSKVIGYKVEAEPDPKSI